MHPNRIFHTETDAGNLAFARARSFGMLCVDGPLVSHVPFLLAEDGLSAGLHLVRSNPIARLLIRGAAPARLVVSGPDGYVSPDWYGIEDQVPTWNYVAVYLTGRLEARPPGELRHLIDAQSRAFEKQLLPKKPWTTDKTTPEVMERMMRQIVPCRLHVEAVEGTWKLNQNKPDDVRMRAADQLEQAGIGQEIETLARLMREA